MNSASASDHKVASRQPAADQDSRADLDGRYGRIGISALIAALPYRDRLKAKTAPSVPLHPALIASES